MRMWTVWPGLNAFTALSPPIIIINGCFSSIPHSPLRRWFNTTCKELSKLWIIFWIYYDIMLKLSNALFIRSSDLTWFCWNLGLKWRAIFVSSEHLPVCKLIANLKQGKIVVLYIISKSWTLLKNEVIIFQIYKVSISKFTHLQIHEF